MSLSRQEVLSRVSELKSLGQLRYSKYERNLRLYESTMNISLSSVRDSTTVGYYKGGSAQDTTVDVSMNIIKSCIDTLTSKISSIKVRPFFNTIKGSYKDIKVVKAAQQYFDQYFDYKHIHKEISECFRCAAIFEKGVLYIDPTNHTVRNILPWQVYYRPSEATYGTVTRIYYERTQYPTTLIPGYTSKSKAQYICYGVYYDINSHTYAELYDDGRVILHEYTSNTLPFVFFHYSNPILGDTSQSVVDLLLPIQLWIDDLANTAKDASERSPANTIFIPKGHGIELHKFTNGIGNMVSYDVPPGMTSSPVTIATPPFIDPQYIETIETLKQTAYELVGISQLSATSQKPTGLDSGVALQTIENIESDRFEMQFDAYIQLYNTVARTCMQVYDPHDTILPPERLRSTVTWEDMCNEESKMTIQFSGADAQSKDPATKAQLVQMYAANGLIPQEMITKMLDLPDVDTSYSYMSNQWDAVHTVIDRCIESNIFDIPPFVSYPLLEKEILNTQLLMFAADYEQNVEDINTLTILFKTVFTAATQMELTQQQQQEAFAASQSAGYTPAEYMQEVQSHA